MGNQVTTLSQIYPVEYYLADYCNDITFDANLGSTRFMKVARVKHKDVGYCVAKIYALNDSSLSLQAHVARLEYIRDSIRRTAELNALPFPYYLINDKCVILLRQYIKYNLYDRLSTRPFLASIEKLWIAYQLLRATQSIHRESICHGDLKSENVLVTSFLWVTLADFASYKPVVLPENNPSDFSYFFNTSRRHCCNMAPERFVEQASLNADIDSTDSSKSNYNAESDPNVLTPQMDMFSLGCVLNELFSDDTPNSSIFDLGQILMFRKGQYDPEKFVEESITDPKVRKLILNMIELEPSRRNSAQYHLEQLVPGLFPAYFNKLYEYFAQLIPLPPDLKILTLERGLDKLMDDIITEYEHGLLLPLLMVTSTLRSLESTDAKLIGLKLCIRLVESSPSVMSEYVIDRLLPYVVDLLAKSESRVRASCVSALGTIFRLVDKLQPSDSNVFVDFILPSLLPLAYDPSALVRISLACNISELAELSKCHIDPKEEDANARLSVLQESFGSVVGQLLADPNNNVRRAVLNENIAKLCLFFGTEKTDEVILSHIITFLNNKSDFRLRAAFFDNISFISSSLGPNYSPVVKPLMQKGLADSEEIVIYKCLKAISSMTCSQLLTKDVIYELFQEAVPLLSFPNKWIRNAVINFILVLSRSEDSSDFKRRFLPAIKLHLHRDLHDMPDEVALLESLQNPLPRCVIESILNGDDNIDEIFYSITKRKMARDKKRYRTISETDAEHFDALINDTISNKNDRELLTNVDQFSEDKLIDSELILRRIHKNKRTSSSRRVEPNISVRNHDTILQNVSSIDSRLLMSSTVSLTRTTKPKGILLADLHEHKLAINKLLVVPNTSVFVSCSNDATIKYWDCNGVSTRPQVLFRSKHTVAAPDAGSVSTIATCNGANKLLALTENNKLHLLPLNTPTSDQALIKTINFGTDQANQDVVTDLVTLSPYSFATSSTSSYIRGYDLRLPTHSDVWSLKLPGSDGLITCIDGNEFCIACGTSSSVISLFDLRFYIKSTTMCYPLHQDRMKKRIRRMMLCNDELYCSVDGNNEVSTWDCESATRTKTLWASQAPCLSSTHSSPHCVLSMIVDDSRDTNSVITAGYDMKIRFWDLVNPHRSYIVSQPPLNAHHKLNASAKRQSYNKQQDLKDQFSRAYYQTKLVDGIQVIQETDKLPSNEPAFSKRSQNSIQSQSNTNATQQVASKQQPQQSTGQTTSSTGVTPSTALQLDGMFQSTAHHDSISCLATVNHSSLLLSASRDGVIKIWR